MRLWIQHVRASVVMILSVFPGVHCLPTEWMHCFPGFSGGCVKTKVSIVWFFWILGCSEFGFSGFTQVDKYHFSRFFLVCEIVLENVRLLSAMFSRVEFFRIIRQLILGITSTHKNLSLCGLIIIPGPFYDTVFRNSCFFWILGVWISVFRNRPLGFGKIKDLEIL